MNETIQQEWQNTYERTKQIEQKILKLKQALQEVCQNISSKNQNSNIYPFPFYTDQPDFLTLISLKETPAKSSSTFELIQSLTTLEKPKRSLNEQTNSLKLDQSDEIQIQLLQEDIKIMLSKSDTNNDNLSTTLPIQGYQPLSRYNRDSPDKPSQAISPFNNLMKTCYNQNLVKILTSPLPEFTYFKLLHPGQKDAQQLPSQYPLKLLKSSQKPIKQENDNKIIQVFETSSITNQQMLSTMNKDPSSKEDCSIIHSLQGITSSRSENILTRVSKKYQPRLQEQRSSGQRRNNSIEKKVVLPNPLISPFADIKQEAASLAIVKEEVREMILREKKNFIQKAQAKQMLLNQQQPIQLQQQSVKKPSILNSLSTKISVWDRFSRGKFLGKGRFSDVFSAQDKITNQIVGLKLIQKTLITRHQLTELLAQEIKIQSYLDHPNILKLYGVLEDQKMIILVVELSGQDLLKMLKAQGKMNESDICDIIYQIASAVAYMHDEGIIHRDLKLENILTYDKQVKLADFGLSIYASQFKKKQKFQLNQYCGTPGYMAPEVSSNLGYDQKADAFSLGIIIYEFQFHSFPQTSDNKIIFPPGKLSPSIEGLMKLLLEFDPVKRISVKDALNHPWFKNQKKISKFDFI